MRAALAARSMLAMPPVLSTAPPTRPEPLPRRIVLALGAAALGATSLGLAGCADALAPSGLPVQAPAREDEAFVMADGERLPYRVWRPGGSVRTVALALHGMNDSRDAWEVSAPVLTAAGIAVYAPDQRGFGASRGRGFWPGGDALVADARAMAGLVRAAHPSARLLLIGESMGGAVLMRLATEPNAPLDACYVMVAPAVWGRARMSKLLRGALWLAWQMAPGYTATRAPGVTITASDNREALIRLSRDPLTVHATRVDAIHGLVDLMDAALAAAAKFEAPGLFLYGGRDQLVPAEATASTWRRLPTGARRAFYPDGYHLLLRDLHRAGPLADVVGWLDAPNAPLASGADAAARAWLARQA